MNPQETDPEKPMSVQESSVKVCDSGSLLQRQGPQSCSCPLSSLLLNQLSHPRGHCSLLLSSGAHKVVFVPSKSLFPQSCVSSGGSMVGLIVTSSKRAYAIPRSAAPRAPVAGHC